MSFSVLNCLANSLHRNNILVPNSPNLNSVLSAITTTSATINFTPPRNTPATNYYCNIGTGNQLTDNGLVSGTAVYVINALDSNTGYNVYLQSINNLGQRSAYSNTINVLTVPGPPSSLSFTSSSAYEIGRAHV